jgi:hypothetical protein
MKGFIGFAALVVVILLVLTVAEYLRTRPAEAPSEMAPAETSSPEATPPGQAAWVETAKGQRISAPPGSKITITSTKKGIKEKDIDISTRGMEARAAGVDTFRDAPKDFKPGDMPLFNLREGTMSQKGAAFTGAVSSSGVAWAVLIGALMFAGGLAAALLPQVKWTPEGYYIAGIGVALMAVAWSLPAFAGYVTVAVLVVGPVIALWKSCKLKQWLAALQNDLERKRLLRNALISAIASLPADTQEAVLKRIRDVRGTGGDMLREILHEEVAEAKKETASA